MLKSKHANTQEEWLNVWNNFRDYRSEEQINRLINETVLEIRSVCRGRNAAYAWSGGKDSIALQIVCEKAGIQKGFCCYNDLYFKSSIDFFKKNLPKGIDLINSGEDEAWLAMHPRFLFPHGNMHHWNVQTHLRYQPIWCKENGVDLLMMGKRTQDGNQVAKELVHTSPAGVNVYCPIRNWVHEDVICAIRYCGLTVSDFYFTEAGFHYGDTKFAVMGPLKGETFSDAWKRIYELEPSKVYKSAMAGIPSAVAFLSEIDDNSWRRNT